MIDAWASQPNYVDHLWPIWQALGPLAGHFFARSIAARRLSELGGTPSLGPPSRGQGWLLVASGGDLRSARGPAVLLEHGTGQAYGDRSIASPGGDGRDAVRLFLATNESVAERDRAAYPGARVEIIGCPRLDSWRDYRPEPTDPPTIGISFHWDGRGWAPEAGTALFHYLPALARLASRYLVLAHAHPRIWARARRVYERIPGLEPVERFEEVLQRAQVYAVDNSSTGFEFAALDRPIAWLNSPAMRRDVHLPPRFWAWADLGPQAEGPDDLESVVEMALADSPAWRTRRAECARVFYPVVGGEEIAANAIREVMSAGV